MLEKCMELITAQQGTDQNNPVYWVGEQLKDIVRCTPGTAELVAKDIEHGGMTVATCERKIKAYADGHKSGSKAVVPPPVADQIIREYFGLGTKEAAAQKTTTALNLMDFI